MCVLILNIFLSVLFFASFFFCCLPVFLHWKKTIFVESARVLLFPCVSLHWWVSFHRSVLFYDDLVLTVLLFGQMWWWCWRFCCSDKCDDDGVDGSAVWTNLMLMVLTVLLFTRWPVRPTRSTCWQRSVAWWGRQFGSSRTAYRSCAWNWWVGACVCHCVVNGKGAAHWNWIALWLEWRVGTLCFFHPTPPHVLWAALLLARKCNMAYGNSDTHCQM